MAIFSLYFHLKTKRFHINVYVNMLDLCLICLVGAKILGKNDSLCHMGTIVDHFDPLLYYLLMPNRFSVVFFCF
jgi:hypothetical protein